MNFSHLYCFMSVATHESITLAAKELFISQPAASKSIKQLENELGVKLFDRKGRNLKLNQQGRIFFTYVSDSLELLNRGISTVKSKGRNNTMINVLFTVGSPFIAEIAVRIKEKMPDIQLNIRQQKNLQKDLKQFDFVISSQQIRDFSSIPLLTEPIELGWKKNSFEITDTNSLIDFVKFDFVSLSDSTELQQQISTFLDNINIPLNFKYQSDEPATVRQLIQSGLGIGFIPKISWHHIDDSIELRKIDDKNLQRTIYLNTPHTTLSLEQQNFKNEVIDVFRA
ncbi:MAG: LysR family transcriptional regulator [Liquorilactobacillus hordei]|uniref:HTH lysR-type domain-containing protein n=1 Tax=Liquorilactobacillus hordei TaxID=468911 RepID=A0A3Q8C977_9LACO|nr:LysR family transcriptional regulator [Liquorilactobacillus hordei]AUJ29454.1 hypothetical protein BSQ49_04115 [Liquorilactobacillus hordei]